jgi:triosephosphate isomerase
LRRPIVAGNWKMNRSGREALALVAELRRELAGFDRVEIVLCPPFTALEAVRDALAGGPLRLGAQDAHWESAGAFTGEIAAPMLRELSCRYVIVGHSERRAFFGETDEIVRRKARAVLAAGMRPIVCVGETLEQREAGQTETVVRGQVERGLADLGNLRRVVIAYEPVWAIGTGRTAGPAQAQAVHAFLRGLLAEAHGPETAAAVRILYGGSVKPANAAELFGQPDVDGGLIGGASLEAASFAQIVRAAAP